MKAFPKMIKNIKTAAAALLVLSGFAACSCKQQDKDKDCGVGEIDEVIMLSPNSYIKEDSGNGSFIIAVPNRNTTDSTSVSDKSQTQQTQ